MFWDKLSKFYKALLVKSLIIRQTMVEVTTMKGIKTEKEIAMVKNMHKMEMVVEIIDIIAEKLAAVREDVEHYLI